MNRWRVGSKEMDRCPLTVALTVERSLIGALDWSRTTTPTPLYAATLEEVSGTHHPLLYLPHTHGSRQLLLRWMPNGSRT
jgi:hypothetical protein